MKIDLEKLREAIDTKDRLVMILDWTWPRAQLQKLLANVARQRRPEVAFEEVGQLSRYPGHVLRIWYSTKQGHGWFYLKSSGGRYITDKLDKKVDDVHVIPLETIL